MPLADFTINVEFETEPSRAVRVVVYDNVKSLRSAATRYDNRTRSRRRKQRGLHPHTLGICHRFEDRDKHGVTKPLCAIVRLAEPNLGVGIISHELAHATVWIRELNAGEAPLTADNDEPFAWLLGDLVRQTVNAMNERGVFDV